MYKRQGEAWLVDDYAQRIESDFVDERHSVQLRYTGANDPSSANTRFQYTWGIVEAPCNVHAGDTKLKMQGSIRPQGLDEFPPALGVLQTAAWKQNLLVLGRMCCSRLTNGPSPSAPGSAGCSVALALIRALRCRAEEWAISPLPAKEAMFVSFTTGTVGS